MPFDYRSDPLFGAVLAYWQRLRLGRAMPARKDIQPRDIHRQLRSIQLIEVSDNGARFRFRLVGTKLAQMFGYDFTGLYHDEVFKGERLKALEKLYRDVCTGKQPIFSRTKYTTTKGFDVYTNRLYFPLSEDGETVTMILGVLAFELPDGSDSNFRPDAAPNVYILEEESVDTEKPAPARPAATPPGLSVRSL